MAKETLEMEIGHVNDNTENSVNNDETRKNKAKKTEKNNSVTNENDVNDENKHITKAKKAKKNNSVTNEDNANDESKHITKAKKAKKNNIVTNENNVNDESKHITKAKRKSRKFQESVTSAENNDDPEVNNVENPSRNEVDGNVVEERKNAKKKSRKFEETLESGENHDETEANDVTKTKKKRRFCAKEFRQSLKTDGFTAIKLFVERCTGNQPSSYQDYALEFVESGGNLREIFQVLDGIDKKNATEILTIFQAFNIVLLKILSTKPDLLQSCEEACREMLVKHYPLIRTMLSLSSTSKQRVAALKLLSSLNAVSSVVAKDVLAYAFFDQPMLEVLTNSGQTDENSSVRVSFIHFLLSFLVDGNTEIVSSLLEKRGLLASIFKGLLFDAAETVQLVLTTVQSKILEDKRLSKTIKMSTFNTQVVKNLVNLYNWKGPVKAKGNFKKRFERMRLVDPVTKATVAECVHRFLLVLCTSKHGVIFRDPTLGLGTKSHNNLILTVLQGLERPWDHSLASELVSKICTVCPDLFKQVISDIVPFLEPRVSQKWLNAIRFLKKLIRDMSVDKVSQYFDTLSTKQLALVVQSFCAPKNIMQIFNHLLHEHETVRHEIVELADTMCKSVIDYVNFIDVSRSEKDKLKIRETMSEYLEQNLPKVSLLMQVWNIPVRESDTHLTMILDILNSYHVLSPNLTENITDRINLLEFLQTIENMSTGDSPKGYDMYIKATNLFLVCDFTVFLPQNDLFTHCFPLLLKIYSKQPETQDVLMQILKNTGIFEGCEQEIKIWLYSILEIGYRHSIGQLMTRAIKNTNEHYVKYSKKLANIKDNVDEVETFDFKELMNNLKLGLNVEAQNTNTVSLSPFIIGILNTALKSTNDQNKSFLNVALTHLLHAQTTPDVLVSVVMQDKFAQILHEHFEKYFRNWQTCEEISALKKIYVKSLVKDFSRFILVTGDIIDIETIECKHHQLVLVTHMLLFYLGRFVRHRLLDDRTQEKCFDVIVFILKRTENSKECLDIILKHPSLIKNFAPNKTDALCTKFILNTIKHLLNERKADVECYLGAYRSVLFKTVHHLLEKNKKLKKPPKNNNFMDVVNLLGFSVKDLECSMEMSSDMPHECLISTENAPSAIIELICYLLNQNVELYKRNKQIKPFKETSILNLSKYLLFIYSYKVEINCEAFEHAICSYIKCFPHLVGCFDKDVFKRLLVKTNARSSSQLAMQILKHNLKCFSVVIDDLDEIIEKRELIFCLLNAALGSFKDCQEIRNIYSKHEHIILKFVHKPQKIAQYLIEHYQVVVELIREFMDDEVCNEIASKVHKFDVAESYHFEILIAIFDKAIKKTRDKKYVSNFISTFMHLVVNILKRGENDKLDCILKTFGVFVTKLTNIYKIDHTDNDLSKSSIFQNYSKLSLKFGLNGNYLLIETLKKICDFCSEDEYLQVLFEMAVSHSESLNILLDSKNVIKPYYVNLLLVLCQKNKSVIARNHIPVWLGAYEGTLSIGDQCLLQLLNMYEQADVGFHEFKPYLWGKVAVGHYSVRFGVETSLFRQPKPAEILDIFDKEKIKFTVTHFSRSRLLTPDQPLYSNNERDVYDPAFYLPLLSQLLAPESTIRWYQCKFGPIALVVMALTSEMKEVRSAACHVLARFHGHLEAARSGKDRLLWIHFVEALCRAASTMEDLRLSTISGIFMARCIMIFNRPDHSLYNALANYIMAKECPDLTYVPEMLELLHSNDVKHVEHRVFILEVMRDGLQTDNDLKVMFKSMSFKLLLDMYSSTVTKDECRRLILQIVEAAVSLPMGARVLSSSYGLMSWLYPTVKKFNYNDSDLLATVINLLHKLVATFESDNFEKTHFSVMLCLVTLVEKIKKIKIELKELVKFVSVLYVVYNHKPCMVSRENLIDLLGTCERFFDCRVCDYYLEFGTSFVQKPNIPSDDVEAQGLYYLKLLTLRWLEVDTMKNKMVTN